MFWGFLMFWGWIFFHLYICLKSVFFWPAFLANIKYSATEGIGRQVAMDGIFLNCRGSLQSDSQNFL